MIALHCLVEQFSEELHISVRDSLFWPIKGVAGRDERLAAPRRSCIDEASSLPALRVIMAILEKVTIDRSSVIERLS